MYYKNQADETLVMLTLAGEQSAYEFLVRRYQKTVVAAAMSVTQNLFMAEDAAQDAFVTAWMKLNTLQEPKKYSSWVSRIAKNCALNMVKRYRSFLPLEVVENVDLCGIQSQNPEDIYALSEEKKEIGISIEKLPEKVRQIIQMHYFEGLSIADIADRMRISEGTVKWQLHDGRKRIRKELCAMNEKYSDTLVERVMKKVEELKLWHIKNSKDGFEKVYRDVLREVEELPESTKKQHALADVLMRGWWWIPGKKNDALFARIAAAAIEGHNEEVMSFIVAREDSKVYNGERIKYIRDIQIPRLEKAGFIKTLGREWFWLGYNLFREGNTEEGKAAYRKVEEILSRDDHYRLLVPYALKMEDIIKEKYSETVPNRFRIGASIEEFRYIDNSLHYWNSQGCGEGYTHSVNIDLLNIFYNASKCDRRFFADIAIGETFIGSDGSTLTFVSDSECVDTPAGSFAQCQLWVVKHWDWNGKSIFKTFYKEGIGIVKQEHTLDGITESVVLNTYSVNKGKGLLPFEEGNRWEYSRENSFAGLEYEEVFTVEYADDKKVMISSWENVNRIGYDKNSWLETISEIRNDYWSEENGQEFICDVYPAINRAEQLAKTPMEIAHTKAATSVARRILSTDPRFNPQHTSTGHWNFFVKNFVEKKKDSIYFSHNNRWSFEWKIESKLSAASRPLLYNDILGILQDATNCIWSDEWRVGASPIVEYTRYSYNVKTRIICEDGGTVITKAGKFDNCLKLCLDIDGMTDGWHYRGGKKNYYFAEGIGIVRTENEYYEGAKTAVYELTRYEGTGEGYMPMKDGLLRRYDAIDLTDGFKGSAEYTYVADDEGDIFIFSDRTGIRELPPPITQYCAVKGEVDEGELWKQGKWQDAQALYSQNNFHLFLHMFARPSMNYMDARRSVELMGLYMGMLKDLGEDGDVPPAWYGLYTWMALVKAAACFGDNNREEGYKNLDTAVEYFKRLNRFGNGELLEAGKKEIFGGVKYIHNGGSIVLPDGTKEPIAYAHRMRFNIYNLHYILTAPSGWEWFNSVRDEERFKECVALVKNMLPKE